MHAYQQSGIHIRWLRGAIKELGNYKNAGMDEIHTEVLIEGGRAILDSLDLHYITLHYRPFKRHLHLK